MAYQLPGGRSASLTSVSSIIGHMRPHSGPLGSWPPTFAASSSRHAAEQKATAAHERQYTGLTGRRWKQAAQRCGACRFLRLCCLTHRRRCANRADHKALCADLTLSRSLSESTLTKGCSLMTTEPAFSVDFAASERPATLDLTTAAHTCMLLCLPKQVRPMCGLRSTPSADYNYATGLWS